MSGNYIEVRTTACHAGSDGECSWAECPQLRDGEPVKSGRHCPLDAVPLVHAPAMTTPTPPESDVLAALLDRAAHGEPQEGKR